MNNEVKRRVFLASIVGTLVGVPIGVRLLTGGKRNGSEHHFAKMLKKFRALSETTVSAIDGPASFKLPLAPPVGEEWKYVFFSPAFLPNELSQAVGGDPDTFYAREGVLYFDRVSGGQVVITGGDTFSGVVSPSGVEEKDKKAVSLLLKDGTLRAAKSQDAEFKNSDIQLQNLLPLYGAKDKDLTPRTRWKGNIGRLKPFAGMPTDYEIVGFAEVSGRKTVNVSFSGKIGGTTSLSGLNEAKPEKNETSSFSYRGNAWFDPETGLLVRQEVDLESTSSGITSYKNRDGDAIMTVKSKLLIQLYDA